MPPGGARIPHSEAVAALREYPGVVGVGLGFKVVGRELTDTFAYCVYVRRKRPLGELAPDERLPTEWNGLPVDVMTALPGPPMPACGPDLEAGDKISLFVPAVPEDKGTLCVVVEKGDPPNKKNYLMTNYHVMEPRKGYLSAKHRAVYAPEHSDCAGISDCNSPVGHLDDPSEGGWPLEVGPDPKVKPTFPYGGKEYVVDVTLVKMVKGRSFANSHSDLGGAINKTIRDLIPVVDAVQEGAVPAPIPVKKRGRTTDLTTGKIKEFSIKEAEGDLPAGTRLFSIWPDAGVGEWEHEFDFVATDLQTLDDVLGVFQNTPVKLEKLSGGPPGTQRLRAHGPTFDRPGDSGAPLINKDRELVGIVYATQKVVVTERKDGKDVSLDVYTGVGHACYIKPVFAAVGLKDDAIAPAGDASRGASIAVPGGPLSAPASGLADLDAEFTDTPARERLRAIAAAHFKDVFALVNERRRVLLVWHRSKGPAFVMTVRNALRDPGGRVPAEIDGVRISTALAAMRDVLELEGGPALREVLERDGDWLIDLAERCAAADDLRAALLEATA